MFRSSPRFLRGLAFGLLLSVAALALSGCGGVPVSSMTYFAPRGAALLESDPGELGLAFQLDPRVDIAPNAGPELIVHIAPRVAGAFPVVDERMRLVPLPTDAAALGLPAADKGRHWRLYGLSAQQAARMRAIQADFRALRKNPPAQGGGGSVSVGVAIEGLGEGIRKGEDNARLESWLRMTQADGFKKLWSGTLGELREMARKRAAAKA